MNLKSLSLVLFVMHSLSAHADIVGGEVVKPQDTVSRSTAALFEPDASGRGGALCTASILDGNTAVTAAHCVNPGGPKPVLLFGPDLHSPETIKRPVTQVKVNPSWAEHQGRGMDQGDIALVQFPGGIPEGYGAVQTMTSDASLKKGEDVVLAGYGISNAQTKAGAGVLRKTRVKLDSPRTGKPEMVLDQSHHHGACHGDSGGPAFVRQGRKMVLAGVTNRSYPDTAPDDCAHKVVYTKVSSYDSWIKKSERQMASSDGLSLRRSLNRRAHIEPHEKAPIKVRRLRHTLRASHVRRQTRRKA